MLKFFQQTGFTKNLGAHNLTRRLDHHGIGVKFIQVFLGVEFKSDPLQKPFFLRHVHFTHYPSAAGVAKNNKRNTQGMHNHQIRHGSIQVAFIQYKTRMVMHVRHLFPFGSGDIK